MFLTVRVSLRKNLTVENRAWLGWLGCLQQPTHHHTQTQNGSHTVFLGSRTSLQQNMQTSNAFCLSAEAGRKCASPLSPRRNRRPPLPGGTAARRDCTERPVQRRARGAAGSASAAVLREPPGQAPLGHRAAAQATSARPPLLVAGGRAASSARPPLPRAPLPRRRRAPPRLHARTRASSTRPPLLVAGGRADELRPAVAPTIWVGRWVLAVGEGTIWVRRHFDVEDPYDEMGLIFGLALLEIALIGVNMLHSTAE